MCWEDNCWKSKNRHCYDNWKFKKDKCRCKCFVICCHCNRKHW